MGTTNKGPYLSDIKSNYVPHTNCPKLGLVKLRKVLPAGRVQD